MKFTSLLRNLLGAFSDGAVLFPLLALLSMKSGFSGPTLIYSTGLMYLVSAVIFRVPMSVQPLKSIAIAAVTVGASFTEVRLSGMLLGLYCLLLCAFDIDRIAKRVPVAIIHQLQVGLGVLLLYQGMKGEWIVLGLALFMILIPEIKGVPILGLTATIGLLISVFSPIPSALALTHFQESAPIRVGLILSLLLPQVILTSANSVLATRDVCERYFGEKASRVTIRRLLYSIGFGNLLMGLIGGMPFCHGSGGVTAHFRGGSRSPWSTGLMGVVLIVLAWIQFMRGGQILSYPQILVSVLLIATGVFHLKLAAPTVQSEFGLFKLCFAALTTVLTKNLLWVLGFGIFFEFLFNNKVKERIYDSI